MKKTKLTFTSNDVMKEHDSVGVGFGPVFCTNSFDHISYFDKIRTNWTVPIPNYGQVSTIYNIDFYRKILFSRKIRIYKGKYRIFRIGGC